MATLEKISAALKLTDVKKSELQKAFENLRSHSPSLSSFDLTWSDVDAYFTAIQTRLQRDFQELETHAAAIIVSEPQADPPPSASEPQADPPPSASSAAASSAAAPPPPLPPPRPELKALCESMDGAGLSRYLNSNPKDRMMLRREIPGALLCAPDPGLLILGAMGGFFSPPKNSKDPGVGSLRRNCIVLLEELMDLKVEMRGNVRERAKKLAMEWISKVGVGGDDSLEALAFLHLMATYGLGSEFDIGYVLDLFVTIGQYRQAIKLSRALIAPENIPDLIKKLIGEGKLLLAVKFVFEYKLEDKFPPVPLLKAFVVDSRNMAKKVCKDGNNSLQSLNEATAKEVSALRQVIKYIEEHNINSEYPKENIEKRIEQLEKQKAERKRPAAAAAAPKPKSKAPPRPWIPKPFLVAASAASKSVSGANLAALSPQQSHLQLAGTFSDHPAQYLGSSTGSYALVGSAPVADPYRGSAASQYGTLGSSMNTVGNLSPTGCRLFPAESHMASGYHNLTAAYDDHAVAAAYDGHALPPQYNTAYYPQ